MKWLEFIALVLIESLAIFGLSLEHTVPQAILISVYVVLLIITITGFITTNTLSFITTNTIKTMKWLGFIALVLVESLAVFGLSLGKIGFTVPQTILISVYVVLLIITITGFIITHFVNLQKEREKEFGILIRELREIKEVVGISETRVIKLESLIENDVRNDIEKVYINVMEELKRKE